MTKIERAKRLATIKTRASVARRRAFKRAVRKVRPDRAAGGDGDPRIDEINDLPGPAEPALRVRGLEDAGEGPDRDGPLDELFGGES